MSQRAILAGILAVVASGCTHRVVLPTAASSEASGCALVVADGRPDPEAIYMRATEGTARGVLEPPAADAIRGLACAQLSPALRSLPVRFTITDLDCTVTGFFVLRYVTDVRGRIEGVPNAPSRELRAGEIVETSDGYIPSGCQSSMRATIPKIAAEIERAMRQ